MTIIVSLVIFSILVLVHEWGHYFAAKKSGVFVYEFAIGMGPVIWKKKGKETLFSLRAFPIGGFVRMSPIDEEEPCPIQNEFEYKNPFQRLGVIIAGPIMNISLALVLMCSLWMISGFPTNRIGMVMPNSPAQKAGINVGDAILEINSHKIEGWEDVLRNISQESQKNQSITLTIQSIKGDKENISLTPIIQDGRFIVGIGPSYQKDFGKSLVYGAKSTWNMSANMFHFLGQLFTGRANAKELLGPVGIVSYVGQAIKAGWTNVILIAAVISLNLGIVNLLPIPALDGNKMLLIIVEIVSGGKKIRPEIEEKISIAGFIILLGILVWVTYQDVYKIFIAQ